MTQHHKSKRIFKIPSFVAWFYPRRVWFGTSQDVFLTFDDGPHPEITPWLLTFLKEEKIAVTFFWNGEQMKRYPEFIQQARDEGHLVGHHGQKHVSPRKMSLREFKTDFDESHQQVSSKLYRPPYGEIKQKQAKYVLQKGSLIMWSWMSYDFDKVVSNRQIIDACKHGVKEKDILVFHENDKTKDRIREILPTIVQVIRDKGLNFATLEKEMK